MDKEIEIKQLPMDTFYMTQEQRENICEALDMLGVALANHKHLWSNAERKAYNRAVKLLK